MLLMVLLDLDNLELKRALQSNTYGKYKNEANTTCVLYLLIIKSNFLYIFMKTCNFQFQSSILSNS